MTRRLTTIAKWINAHRLVLGLRAEIVEGYCNTDRKVGRLRSPGKGRTGNRLLVYPLHKGERDGLGRFRPVLDHNAAETYRSNDEVERWLAAYVAKLPAAKRRALEAS